MVKGHRGAIHETWKIISVIPPSSLVPPWRVHVYGAAFFLLFVFGMIIWFWTKAKVSKDEHISALKESENRFRTVTNSVRDAIIMMDSTGATSFWNAAASKLFGYEFDDDMGQNLHAFIAPERLQREISEGLLRFKEAGKAEVFGGILELPVHKKDGTEFIAELSVNYIEIKGEGFALGIVRDITERKRVEEELKRHRENLEELVEERTRKIEQVNKELEEANMELVNNIDERKQKENLIMLGAKISQSLTLGNTLRETLQSITDIFVNELNVVFARIWVVDEIENALKLEASSGLYVHIEGAHEIMSIGGDTKISRAVFEQQPHISNNIQESPYIKDKEWAMAQGLKSFAGIPMIVEGRSVGALVVFSREIIQEHTIHAILSISGSIAVAIERSRAEETALASERKLRAMSESSHDGLIMVDAKADIAFWNPAAEKIFGYSADEAIGKNLHQLVVLPAYRQLAKKGVEKFAQTGEGMVINNVIERQALRKDGNTFPAEISVSAFQVDDEWHAVGTVRDITERKKAEEAIKASEERFQTILNTINTGVIIIDPENRTIVDVNPVAAQMIGLTREKIIGHICHQFICPKAVNDCPVLDHNQEIDNAERVLVTTAGKEIPILKTVTLVSLGGKPHLLESFIDITDRKKAEQELQQHLQDLKQFEKLAIGREERMINLKEEINGLLGDMGKPPKYKIVD
jgi:PAS domain S-box-containing protein